MGFVSFTGRVGIHCCLFFDQITRRSFLYDSLCICMGDGKCCPIGNSLTMQNVSCQIYLHISQKWFVWFGHSLELRLSYSIQTIWLWAHSVQEPLKHSVFWVLVFQLFYWLGQYLMEYTIHALQPRLMMTMLLMNHHFWQHKSPSSKIVVEFFF